MKILVFVFVLVVRCLRMKRARLLIMIFDTLNNTDSLGVTVFLYCLTDSEHQVIEQIDHSKQLIRTSLVAQWLRIRLPMQGTRV